MEPVSLDSLQGWWENPYSQNGIGMHYVKGNQVFIGNVQVKEVIKIGAGRKLKFADHSGVVDSTGTEISWDKGKIIWTHIGDLPDMYDPCTTKGRFKYTRLLGKGANGVVCEAIDMSAAQERKVAVKVLLLATLSSKREIYKSAMRMHFEFLWSHMFLHNQKHKHFNTEHGRLFLQYLEDHTGIPPADPKITLASDLDLLNQIDYSNRVSKLPYVLMELAKGETSWTALFAKEAEAAKLFSVRDKRDLCMQMVIALEYLRKFDLVHRDLNFHNLFLSKIKGRVGVAIGDFGMMSSRTQALLFAPCEEEAWKMRDWVPWEAWNFPVTTTNGRNRAQSPMIPLTENCYHEESWQAFDVFSIGVLHLYMCLGQQETRRILEAVRGGQHCSELNGLSARRLILDPDIALRMISKDPDDRPKPYELLASLQSGGTLWSILTCPYRCIRAPPTQNGSRYRSRSRGHGASKRRVYLPMELNGKKVLVKEGVNTWRVTKSNMKVKPPTRGLGHRKSKNIDDHIDGPQAMVQWGESVFGVDAGDGWVQCETEVPV